MNLQSMNGEVWVTNAHDEVRALLNGVHMQGVLTIIHGDQ